MIALVAKRHERTHRRVETLLDQAEKLSSRYRASNGHIARCVKASVPGGLTLRR